MKRKTATGRLNLHISLFLTLFLLHVHICHTVTLTYTEQYVFPTLWQQIKRVGLQFFKYVLKLESDAQMNTDTFFPCCKHPCYLQTTN